MTEICQDDAMVGARTAAPRQSTTKPYSSALRDRQVAQTRELILDAVTTLLGDRRADEVTTREIAAVAGVSERTVYRHFPDRDALLEGLSLRVSGIDGVKPSFAVVRLEDIAATSKVGVRYLEYIEADRFDRLPAPVYLRGFVQEYARVIHLDPRRTAESYLAYVAARDSRK